MPRPSTLLLTLAFAVVVILAWCQGGRLELGPSEARYFLFPKLLFWVNWIALILLLLVLWKQTMSSSRPVRFLLGRLLPFLPWVLLAGFVFLSLSNPSAEQGPGGSLIGVEHQSDRPSTPHPERTEDYLRLLAAAMLLGGGVFLAAASLTQIRRLLMALFLNGLVAAIVGTPFYLLRSKKILGFMEPVNHQFFSSFRYHNAWGGYLILILAAGLGLVSYALTRTRSQRNQSRGAGDKGFQTLILLLVGVALIVPTLFMGGGRASWAAGVPLILLAPVLLVAQAIWKASPKWRLPVGVFGAAIAAAIIGGTIFLADYQIQRNTARTQAQIEAAQQGQALNLRQVLMKDAFTKLYLGSSAQGPNLPKPKWGWGLGSSKIMLPVVQDPKMYAFGADREEAAFFRPRPVEFVHNDWIQYLVELGWIGFSLLAIPPLWLLVLSVWKGRFNSISFWLAMGVGSVLCLAAVEFPLSNPTILILFSVLYGASAKYAILSRRKHGSGATGPPSKAKSKVRSAGV